VTAAVRRGPTKCHGQPHFCYTSEASPTNRTLGVAWLALRDTIFSIIDPHARYSTSAWTAFVDTISYFTVLFARSIASGSSADGISFRIASSRVCQRPVCGSR